MLRRRILPFVLLPLVFLFGLASSAGATTITGTVLRSDDTPLPGAGVEVIRLPGAWELLDAYLDGHAPGPVLARATTGPDGRFVLAEPGAGVWQVRVEAAGFVPMSYPMLLLANPVELPPVVLQPAVAAEVEVVDGRLKPLAGAGVLADSADDEIWKDPDEDDPNPWRPASRFGWSDEDGRLVLPRAPGERLHLRVRHGGRVETVFVRAVRRAKVRFDDGAADVHTVRVLEPDGGPGRGIVALARQMWPIGRAGEDGVVTLRGRLDEPLALYVVSPDGRVRSVTLEPPAEGGGAEVVATLAERVRVAGRVTGEDGTAIAGAVVWPGHSPGAFVTTGADGRFALEVPARERSRLQAHAAGFVPRSEVFASAVQDDVPEVGFVLLSAGTAAGRVVDDAGRPLAGVRLAAIARGDQERTRAVRLEPVDARAVSDTQGRFVLTPLEPGLVYELEARRRGFSGAVSTLGGDERPRDLELVLTEGRSGFGRVVDGDGEALGGAEVRVTATGGGDAVVAESDAEGRFEVRRLPAERLDLAAKKSGLVPLRVRGVEVPPGDGRVDLGTLVLVPGATLRARVESPGGEPIAGAAVRTGPDQPGEPGEPDATSDEEGRFELAGLEPGGPVRLRLDAAGFLPEELDRVPVPGDEGNAPGEPLVVVLRPGARVSGEVVDDAGRPIAGAQVTVAEPEEVPGTASDDEGHFALDALPPGVVVVEARARGFQPALPHRLELAAGDHLADVRFVLAEGAVVEGRVTDADGAPVEGARLTAGPALARSDAGGVYRLEGVVPGPRRVGVTHPGFEPRWRELDVGPGTNHADFELAGGHPVAGRVVDTSGLPLGGVELLLEDDDGAVPGVRSGDDGAFRFAAVRAGAYHLRAARRGWVETSPPEVEVDGTRVEGLEVVMAKGATVSGRVSGLEPEDLARVVVRARAEGRPGRPGEVDFEGRYEVRDLAPDDWTLEASLPDGSRQARARVSLAPGTGSAERDLEFGRGLTLTGVVLHREAPMPGTRITLNAYGAPLARTVTADLEGRFRIADLPPGDYWLDLAHPGERLIHKEDLALLADREVVLEFVTAEVSGHVVDAETGQPVGDVSILMRQLSDGERPGTVYGGPSDAGGVFSFSGLAPGRYRLEARAEGFQASEHELEVAAGAVIGGLVVSLGRAEGLELAVALASGERPRFVTVSGIDDGGRRFTATRPGGESGVTRFANLPAGRWRLLVGGTGGAAVEVAATVPGEPLAVVLPTAGRLRVRIPELVEDDTVAVLTIIDAEGRPFRHLAWGGELAESWRVTGGRATVEGLPAGLWTLRATGPSGRTWTASAVTTGGPAVEVSLDGGA